ncbi:MAG: Pyridoxal-dependent decarboxylase [Chloroflexi bacterium]|nr:Pyridoxal-dependent decarboxylase [Chloroflexota bacterium]
MSTLISRGGVGEGGPAAGGRPPALWAAGSEAGLAALEQALAAVAGCWRSAAAARRGPYSGASPERLERLAAAVEVLPEEGRELSAVLEELGGLAIAHAVDPAHPHCAAHLHCAPLVAAVAADALVSAVNPSLDSWDQAPIAGHLEQRVVSELARLAGLPGGADGVFTSGGTQSNLMALLLARDAAAAAEGRTVAVDGLGPDAARHRILCSEAAHFTVQRSASLLGLGSAAVETVAVDGDMRMRCDDLDERLERLAAERLRPMALVATAGTTDFGSIDPLAELAARTRRHRMWLHVDASYGGGLLVSDRHRGLLDGLELADSVAVDFHKLLWQPIACGAFLVRDRAALAPLAVEVPYLNAPPEEPEGGGWRMPHLLGRSLSTSRRFDALKLLVSLHTIGRRRLGELVDRTLALTALAAELVGADPRLEPAHRPVLASLVFRYVPQPDRPQRSDRLNAAIRDRLLAEGRAVLGRTTLAGRTHLKLTLLNPAAGEGDIVELVDLVARTGAELETQP